MFLLDEDRPPVGDDWLGVELRHLAAVAAVAEEGSFRGAARRLAYVQSSISHQVAQLEHLVGLRLIERSRGGGGVTLTEAGELLLEHSREILTRFKAAQADLVALADGSAATVRVGAHQSAATRLMPLVLPRFARTWPDARVVVTEAATDLSLFERIEDGTLDLAFADLPVEPGPFATCKLLVDPFVLIVPTDSHLARLDRPVQWADLAGMPLIAPKTARYLPLVEAQMRAQGMLPTFAYRSEIEAAVHTMASATRSAAILPRLAANAADERTALVDLSNLIAPRSVVLIWHEERRLPKSIAGFRDAAMRACERDATSPVRTNVPASS